MAQTAPEDSEQRKKKSLKLEDGVLIEFGSFIVGPRSFFGVLRCSFSTVALARFVTLSGLEGGLALLYSHGGLTIQWTKVFTTFFGTGGK